ncbi:hypothetical protein MESS4_160082 [Mesorhizobium sp. STM 4661]|nr:hypothetical protein MESS4_160082 [Mesorhizobium sp. STM 4661]
MRGVLRLARLYAPMLISAKHANEGTQRRATGDNRQRETWINPKAVDWSRCAACWTANQIHRTEPHDWHAPITLASPHSRDAAHAGENHTTVISANFI